MQSNKRNKIEGCSTGLFMGSLMRSIVEFVLFVVRILAKILIIFGLWVPVVYAIFGLVLNLSFDFNPFDFSLYSTIYLSGAVACIICSLIIAVKNLLINPAKSIYKGYKNPLWERPKEVKEDKEDIPYTLKNRWEVYGQTKKEVELNPPDIKEFKAKKPYPTPEYLLPNDDFRNKTKSESDKARITLFPNWLPKKVEKQETVMVSTPQVEKPFIYFSKLEPNILVHEYQDRYELYRLEGNIAVPVRVEYK